MKGEAFEMPERSTKYGVFVDNQGTGSVYSLLCTQQGVNGSDEAVISIYRQGELKGSFVDNGNGELEFSSEDGSVKGIIQINGWDGASFEVTETSNPDAFPVGQKRNFRLRFKENRISESNTPRPDRSAMPGGAGGVLCAVSYQIPSTCCMSRLMEAMPTQQQKPKASGLPPVLMSFTMFVFKPTAHMARTMKNLLSVLRGENTDAETPREVAIVVMTEASTK